MGNQEQSEENIPSAAETVQERYLQLLRRVNRAFLEGKQSVAQQRLHLTPRERDIFSLLGRDLTGKEIGEQLHISLSTVRNHLGHIFDKGNFTTALEAALYGVISGIIDPTETVNMDIVRRFSLLTNREAEVVTHQIEFFGRFSGDKEIAERMGIAPKTVRVHFGNILQKTGATNRTQVGLHAYLIFDGITRLQAEQERQLVSGPQNGAVIYEAMRAHEA